MTNEESLELLSTRYIAPRVVRLTSGRIAIIPMMGRGEPVLVESWVDPLVFAEEILRAIPSIDALEAQYHTLRDEVIRRPTAASRALQPTADDLA